MLGSPAVPSDPGHVLHPTLPADPGSVSYWLQNSGVMWLIPTPRSAPAPETPMPDASDAGFQKLSAAVMRDSHAELPGSV